MGQLVSFDRLLDVVHSFVSALVRVELEADIPRCMYLHGHCVYSWPEVLRRITILYLAHRQTKLAILSDKGLAPETKEIFRDRNMTIAVADLSVELLVVAMFWYSLWIRLKNLHCRD